MKINYRFQEESADHIYRFNEDNNSQYFRGLGEEVHVSANTDYNRLSNKPRIGTVELIGSVSLPELGLRAIYYDTTANWNAQHSLITEPGTVYIYSDYSFIDDGNGNLTPVAGIKIGDGSSYLIDMPFMTDALTATLLSHVGNGDVHITPQERVFWNNKVSSYMDMEADETLILSKTHYELEGEIHHA